MSLIKEIIYSSIFCGNYEYVWYPFCSLIILFICFRKTKMTISTMKMMTLVMKIPSTTRSTTFRLRNLQKCQLLHELLQSDRSLDSRSINGSSMALWPKYKNPEVNSSIWGHRKNVSFVFGFLGNVELSPYRWSVFLLGFNTAHIQIRRFIF